MHEYCERFGFFIPIKCRVLFFFHGCIDSIILMGKKPPHDKSMRNNIYLSTGHFCINFGGSHVVSNFVADILNIYARYRRKGNLKNVYLYVYWSSVVIKVAFGRTTLCSAWQ